MGNLVKYVGIGLLVLGLAACDNSDSKTAKTDAAAKVAQLASRLACWTEKLALHCLPI